jgi:hypothetical protein
MKSNTFKTLKIAIAIFIIVGFLGGVIKYGVGKYSKAMENVSNAVTEFMQLNSDGKIKDAYAMTSIEFQEQNSFEQYDDFINSMPWLFKDFQSIQIQSSSINSQSGGSTNYNISGNTIYNNNDLGTFEFALIGESNSYKILEFSLRSDVSRYNLYQ